MSNFETIKSKLEEFIKRYYTNALLKGAILFFAMGLLYFMVTLFIEYVLWLNPTARTILFWLFVVVEVTLFIKFIALPLLHLFNLRKGINFETASALIGNHFPEVNDKLLNVLQLNQSPQQSDLLLASIEQKSLELQPIPFKAAINFKSNAKYLKYAAIPVLILVVSLVSGKINWFSDSYERVVNYKTAYEPPAPFQFFILNESLEAVENKDFKLHVSTAGEVIPENAEIKFNGQSYFLQPITPGQFQYTFTLPKDALEFRLTANGVTSKSYQLQVVNTPNLVNFDMVLDYPAHTQKQDEVLKSTGSAVIPEGTKVTWKAKTKATTKVQIFADDTLTFTAKAKDNFEATKQLFKHYNYNLTTSNQDLKDYENLAYNISVVKDLHPELTIKVQKDSIDQQSLYFYGQASDDYGLSKLQMVYYPAEDSSKKVVVPMALSKANFSEFVSAFPNQFNLEEGVSYQLYFEVFDNDAIHQYKRTKSATFNYRKLTKEETEEKQLNEQSETIKDISKTFQKLEEQDKSLDEFSKTQKEKERLNFNDKKKFEDFLKRQKNQEQLMKNFNKKLQDNLQEFQKEEQKEHPFKDDLIERLKDNEEQLKKDEKLLEELEKLKDKINKEQFTQKLEELAKQNKNKKRSMQQLLELTKRFYVMKKAEKISNELKELSDKQEQLSESKDKNSKAAQEELNKEFKQLQEDLEDLKSEDRKLRKPMKVPTDEFLEDEIKYDQKAAKEALESQEKKEGDQDPKAAQEAQEKAKEKQKSAAKKMRKMAEMLEQSMSGGGGGGSQDAEDMDTLRQILENLLNYSFDQEALMETFEDLDSNSNKYGSYIIEQSNLRAHFEHIDDSLFALSMRQPKLSEHVNKQITEVYFNIDKALSQLTENNIYLGVGAQQYAVTATNELANFLSDVLDQMEMAMQPQMGQGEGDGESLPDIIMSQEELNKKMEEGVKKGKEGSSGEEGNEKGEGEKPGESGKEGEGEKPGEQGQSGNEGQQGESGENGQSGQQGKSGQSGQSGENGQDGEGNSKGQQGKNGQKGKGKGDGPNGDSEGEKNDGYGEGGSEEQNAELYKIYQQQQQLRQALEDRLTKDGTIQSAGQLIRQMEAIELDLLNTGFTNQTLQKMMDVQHQLLKMENATFMQGQDKKRKSETSTESFNPNQVDPIKTAKQYFNTTEILNRQALPLQEHLKKKIQEYFKREEE